MAAHPLVSRLKTLHEACEDDDADALLLCIMSSALVHQEPAPKTRGGSKKGRSANLDRDHAGGHQRLHKDYLDENPVFPERLFRRRFRMSRALCFRIHDAVLQRDDYFRQRPDATGKVCLSSHQKVCAAVRKYCYGEASDRVDEYLRLGESTATDSFEHFTDAVIACFKDEYLRQPTEADIRRHTRINERRGFVGMYGSLDCTHWGWKNCPSSLKGQCGDREGNCYLILEAVSTQDLWIWHAFVGLPGFNNDLNVLGLSPLVVNWLKEEAPKFEFTVNGNAYKSCYLLCDGIYPAWSVFVKTISNPQSEKEKWFSKRQEAARKDVERCFGVLKGRFHVLAHPALGWDIGMLRRVWTAAIIMHNMIEENQGEEQDDCHTRATSGWDLVPKDGDWVRR